MKGDIAFVGFMLTADEWQALDAEARAQLIAVATRRADPWFDEPRRRLAEGTGPHEIIEVLDADVAELIEDDDAAERAHDDAVELSADGTVELAAGSTADGAVKLERGDRLFDDSDIPDEISFADLAE